MLSLSVAACESSSDEPAPSGEGSTGSTAADSGTSQGGADDLGDAEDDATVGEPTAGEPAECTPESVDKDCPPQGPQWGCVDPQCIEGECVFEPRPDGTACTYERLDGACYTGSCVYDCQETADCFGQTCRPIECIEYRCVDQDPLDGVPAPDDAQTEGDCQQIVCQAGEPVEEEDESDPLDDEDPCTVQMCVRGETVYELAPEGTRCPDGTCDGAGACVANP